MDNVSFELPDSGMVVAVDVVVILILTLFSAFLPLFKLRRIKPINIIRAKE